MSEYLSSLAPILLIFVLGLALRRARVVQREDGGLLLKLFFYAALPALIGLSVSEAELSPDLIALPIGAVLTHVVTLSVATLIGRRLRVERQVFGVALVGSMIMNGAFVYPFLLMRYGAAGLAQAALFDLGNVVMVVSVAYALAYRYGEAGERNESALKRLVLSPPVWALTLSLMLRAAQIQIPDVFASFLQSIADMTTPLLMLALGIFFSPRLVRPGLLTLIVLTRMGVGLLCGLFLGALFGLQGVPRIVMAMASAAPVGFNALTFSTLAKLDVEFAASLVSVSVLLGMIYMPVLSVLLA
jgi:predicted permease